MIKRTHSHIDITITAASSVRGINHRRPAKPHAPPILSVCHSHCIYIHALKLGQPAAPVPAAAHASAEVSWRVRSVPCPITAAVLRPACHPPGFRLLSGISCVPTSRQNCRSQSLLRMGPALSPGMRKPCRRQENCFASLTICLPAESGS